jgi:hypothetical protein
MISSGRTGPRGYQPGVPKTTVTVGRSRDGNTAGGGGPRPEAMGGGLLVCKVVGDYSSTGPRSQPLAGYCRELWWRISVRPMSR